MKLNLPNNFIKAFSVLAILSFSNSWGQVTLPHYDGLDYPENSTLQTQTGWTVGNSGDDLVIVAGSLNQYGLPTSTGRKVQFGGAGIDAFKAYTPQSVGFGTIYYSFLLNVTSVTGLNATGGYQTGISDSANGFASTMWLKSDGAGSFVIGFAPRTSAATVQWNTTSSVLNTTYMIVVALNSVTGTVNDVSKFWINPVLGGSEPTPLFSATNTGIDLTNISRIIVRQGSVSDTPAIMELDELRIGLTWQSVTPALPTWNGTAWSNVSGPTSLLNALIQAPYNTTTNGSFTAKNLTVTPTGSLTVSSGTSLDIKDAITNNAAATAVVVESNGNILQTGVTNTNVGNITVNRNSTPMIRLDYTFWASPVAGQNLLSFSPATLTNRFYDYDENANNFTNAGLPANFVQGKGYSVRAPNTYNNTPTTFNGSFVGLPNNGTITVPVFNTGAPKGYNILGNPYPSPISAVDFLTANTNVSSIYYWTHTSQLAGAGENYATFNGTGTASIAGGLTPNNFIQTGQGFIVKAINGPDVTFLNTMRVANYANQFFRTSNVVTNENDKNRIWLNLSSTVGSLSQTLIGYVPNATNGLDNQFDASLFENTGSKLYSVINNSEYAIQGKALPFSNTDSVTLGFKTDVAGSYTISIAQLDGLFSGNQNVFLLDNLTGITHNLKSSNYTFATNAGTFNARFSLVYQAVLKVENPVFDSNSVVVYTKDNALNINSGNMLMNNVKVFDIRGSLVYEKNNINSVSTSINDLSLSNGVLIVKITSTEGNIVSKKVLF